MSNFYDWLMRHRTKTLGLAQISIAQVMLWDFVPSKVGVALASLNGLLTVWVGYVNSHANDQEPPNA